MTIGENAVEFSLLPPYETEEGLEEASPNGRILAVASPESASHSRATTRVQTYGRFDDLVRVDKQGRAHREDGKFLSNYELDQVASHQQLIREGVDHRTAERADREAAKRKLLGIYGVSGYRQRYSENPLVDPDAWARREYSVPPKPLTPKSSLTQGLPLYAGNEFRPAQRERARSRSRRLERVARTVGAWAVDSRLNLLGVWRDWRYERSREGYMHREMRRERLRERLGNTAVVLALVGAVGVIGYAAYKQDKMQSGSGGTDPYADICKHPGGVEEARIFDCTAWLKKHFQQQAAEKRAKNTQTPSAKREKKPKPQPAHKPRNFTMHKVVLRPGSGDSLWREERQHHPKASEHNIWVRVRHDMVVNQVPTEYAAVHMWGPTQITR